VRAGGGKPDWGRTANFDTNGAADPPETKGFLNRQDAKAQRSAKGENRGSGEKRISLKRQGAKEAKNAKKFVEKCR